MGEEERGEALATALGELASATEHAEHLRVAVVSNRRIGMAMGILMERHRLTEEQAFDRLRELSQRRNTKMRQLADQLIHTGVEDPHAD